MRKPLRSMMIALTLLGVGYGIGYAAKGAGKGISLFRGKAASEAANAALTEAERLAEGDSWELIAIGRVWYLSGDQAKGQAFFDRVTQRKPEPSDWQRIGDVYAEAEQFDKAEACYQKVLASAPKDDTGQSEIGAWYVRRGQREKGEELFAKALERNPDDLWHYVRAAEAYLGVAKGR